jgi:hypothetical protein
VAEQPSPSGDVGAMSLDAAIAKLKAEVADRTVRKTFGGDAGLGEQGASHVY